MPVQTGISLISTEEQNLSFARRESTVPSYNELLSALPQAYVTEIAFFLPLQAPKKKKQTKLKKTKNTPNSQQQEFQQPLRDKAGQRANSKRQWLLKSDTEAVITWSSDSTGQNTKLECSLAQSAPLPRPAARQPTSGPRVRARAGATEAGRWAGRWAITDVEPTPPPRLDISGPAACAQRWQSFGSSAFKGQSEEVLC